MHIKYPYSSLMQAKVNGVIKYYLNNESNEVRVIADKFNITVYATSKIIDDYYNEKSIKNIEVEYKLITALSK